MGSLNCARATWECLQMAHSMDSNDVFHRSNLQLLNPHRTLSNTAMDSSENFEYVSQRRLAESHFMSSCMLLKPPIDFPQFPINMPTLLNIRNGENTQSYWHSDESSGVAGHMYPSHSEPKPNFSYIGLIAKAILSTVDRRMILSEIYQWIQMNYPYFRSRGPGWRNSIRHNLSLNDCFIKVGRAANGKGHYWGIHPANLSDFLAGDFRRRRAQRKVRQALGLAGPVDDRDTPSPHSTTQQVDATKFCPKLTRSLFNQFGSPRCSTDDLTVGRLNLTTVPRFDVGSTFHSAVHDTTVSWFPKIGAVLPRVQQLYHSPPRRHKKHGFTVASLLDDSPSPTSCGPRDYSTPRPYKIEGDESFHTKANPDFMTADCLSKSSESSNRSRDTSSSSAALDFTMYKKNPSPGST